MKTLFRGGLVYHTPQRRFLRADLLLENGRIADTDFSGDPTKDTEIIDCAGSYIIPGLVDVHTHGRGGYDFNTADAVGCRAMRRSYAEVGTTTVLATLASAPKDALYASMEAIGQNRGTENGLAHIAGIHLEGRYLNPLRRGAHDQKLLAPLDADEVLSFLDKMAPAPMRISAAFELEGSEDFLQAVLSRGAIATLAHSDATYDEAMSAVAKGVTGFTHTFNAMRPLHHREPGNVAASLLCDEAYTELICDGEHIHPAMIAMAARLKPQDKVVLITDSMEGAGCPDGSYEIAGLPVLVKNGKAVNEEGAIAGSTLDMFTALKNYMAFTGLSLEEALPAATANPAAMTGLTSLCGSIERGLRADLLILQDKNAPAPASVWIAGKKI